jgi:hypothetical protein
MKSKVTVCSRFERTDEWGKEHIFVHNSCRSQIAEALGSHFAGNGIECYLAGTETKPQIS